jgi:hypothetical protein
LNTLVAAKDFVVDTYKSKGQNLVQAAENTTNLAKLAYYAPGAAGDLVVDNAKKGFVDKIAENGSVNGAVSNIVGGTLGGIVLGAATDKGLSKLGTVAKVASKLDGPAVEVAEGGIPRIQNAANKIDKPITLVGSRASGTANSASDFDYVIPGLKNAEWKKIKNSLPGAANAGENLPKRIDVFKGSVDTSKPHITVTPKKK